MIMAKHMTINSVRFSQDEVESVTLKRNGTEITVKSAEKPKGKAVEGFAATKTTEERIIT